MLQEGYRRIEQNQANALLESVPKCVLIDVRTPSEYRNGHIDGACNIPVEEFKSGKALTYLPPDHDTPLLLYCRSGRRAETAGQLLVRWGYKYVMNFGAASRWMYGLTAGD